MIQTCKIISEIQAGNEAIIWEEKDTYIEAIRGIVTEVNQDFVFIKTLTGELNAIHCSRLQESLFVAKAIPTA